MTESIHTPTGEYPKPAPVHEIDLETTADRLMATLQGGHRRTESLARESGVSVLMMAMEAGDEVKEHSADGVVTVQLVRGHATLTAQGAVIDVTPGQLVVFQPGVRHDVRALEQSVALLTITGGGH